MRHEICDSFEHAPGLQDKCGESDSGEIHSNSIRYAPTPKFNSSKSIRGSVWRSQYSTRLSWDIKDVMIDPSSSSLVSESKSQEIIRGGVKRTDKIDVSSGSVSEGALSSSAEPRGL